MLNTSQDCSANKTKNCTKGSSITSVFFSVKKIPYYANITTYHKHCTKIAASIPQCLDRQTGTHQPYRTVADSRQQSVQVPLCMS
jgi:hypothetical protein